MKSLKSFSNSKNCLNPLNNLGDDLIKNKFSVENSPIKEINNYDEGMDEHNKCLKNALSEAIEENEKVRIFLAFYKFFFCKIFREVINLLLNS